MENTKIKNKNTWEIHEKYMGNTCFHKIHGKYMGNTWGIHEPKQENTWGNTWEIHGHFTSALCSLATGCIATTDRDVAR